MELFGDVDFKALVFGAAIAATFIIFGFMYNEWLYPFSAMGLLYAGYAQKNITYATVIGAIASTPIIVLAFQGYMGMFSGYFATEEGLMLVAVLIIIVGAFIGFVGGWAKRDRIKAQEQYDKKQNIGKKKKKKKNA